MNILMIPTWYSPHDAEVMSAGVFHYEQSIALQKYCNIALYYPFDQNLDCNFLKAAEKGLLTYRCRKSEKGKLLNYFRIFFNFLRINREFKPDLIHSHVASEAGKISVFLGKLFNIPVVITEHTPIELAGLEKPRTKYWVKYAYHNSKANICVSENSKNQLKAFFPEEKFQVIYNGIINPGLLTQDGKVYALKGFINCCIVAAFYSKEIKGYQYLLPAIKELKMKGYSIILHICGGGEYYDYYVDQAKQLKIEDCCIFYGQCERQKVYSIMAQMDFSISASIFECSGVSVQEAMLLGKPLVVTKSGGANSLVTENTAIVVERGSVKALVEGIEKMIQHLHMFNKEIIQKYAYENFEIDEVSKKYIELYKSVLEK